MRRRAAPTSTPTYRADAGFFFAVLFFAVDFVVALPAAFFFVVEVFFEVAFATGFTFFGAGFAAGLGGGGGGGGSGDSSPGSSSLALWSDSGAPATAR